MLEFAQLRSGSLEPEPDWAIQDRDEMLASVLDDLGPWIPRDLVREALTWLEPVQRYDLRWRILAALAPALSESERSDRIEAELPRVPAQGTDAALLKLAPQMGGPRRNELLGELWAGFCTLNVWEQGSAMERLAPYLSDADVARGVPAAGARSSSRDIGRVPWQPSRRWPEPCRKSWLRWLFRRSTPRSTKRRLCDPIIETLTPRNSSTPRKMSLINSHHCSTSAGSRRRSGSPPGSSTTVHEPKRSGK